MRTRLAAVAAVSLLLLAGCGGSDSPPADDSGLDLDGRTFVGDQVTVDDEPRPLVDGSVIRLTFGDGSVGAAAGCNSMSGAATWGSGTLDVDTLAMTEMACDEPLMDQDAWLADLLTSSPALTQDGASLTLTSGGTVITLTDEEVAVPEASLTGTTWVLDSIIDGDAASSVPEGVRSTLQLKKSGLALAELGCNTGRGGYAAGDATISFEPMATTLMACGDAAMEVESAVAGALQGTVDYAINGDRLTITTSADGAVDQLVYRAS